MIATQQQTQRFDNPAVPLLMLTPDGRRTESNQEHISGILEELLPALLQACPHLAAYFEENPTDLQDLVDMIAIHEHGEPDYDGNGNSDMPLSHTYTKEQHLSVKEQERAKFETWVLPMYAVEDQPRLHQLYLEFESCESGNWVVQLANVLDRVHGDITSIERRLKHLTAAEIELPLNTNHTRNALLKAAPHFLQLLDSLHDKPMTQKEIAVFLEQHLDRFSQLGYEAHLSELTELKQQLRHP